MSMVTLSLSSNGHPVHCASVFLRNENFGWKLCYVFSSSLSHQPRREAGGLVTCQGVVATGGGGIPGAGACCSLVPGYPKELLGKLMPRWEGTTGAVLQLLCPYHPQGQAKGHCSPAQSVGSEHIWLLSPALV